MTAPTEFPTAPPRRPGLAEAQVPFGVPRSMPIGALPVPAFGRAVAELAARGAISGARSQKLSVRVDPLVLAAAADRLGLPHPSDVINAALALAAAPDRFKTWLRDTTDSLTEDFQPGP
ncbi:MAG: hypothetical protein ACP5NP_10450 [Acetobacteraceae bacterium]